MKDHLCKNSCIVSTVVEFFSLPLTHSLWCVPPCLLIFFSSLGLRFPIKLLLNVMKSSTPLQTSFRGFSTIQDVLSLSPCCSPKWHVNHWMTYFCYYQIGSMCPTHLQIGGGIGSLPSVLVTGARLWEPVKDLSFGQMTFFRAT